MATKRVVNTEFWTDEKVVEMFSPEDKLFMLYLLTNPHTKQLGIYRLVKKQCAFELGYSVDTISVLFERFENKYQIIKYSNSTSEIAIKNFLVHSIVKGGKPVEDCLLKDINEVKNKSLLKYVFDNLYNKENLNETVIKIIDNYKNNGNDKENEYDNDNDNERIVDESCNSVKNNANRFRKPTIEEIEQYCIERDNGIDAQYFFDYYERNGWVVGKTKMKDWKAAVRTWERNKNQNTKQNQSSNSQKRIVKLEKTDENAFKI